MKLMKELVEKLTKMSDNNIALNQSNNALKLKQENLEYELSIARTKIQELECKLGNLELDLNRADELETKAKPLTDEEIALRNKEHLENLNNWTRGQFQENFINLILKNTEAEPHFPETHVKDGLPVVGSEWVTTFPEGDEKKLRIIQALGDQVWHGCFTHRGYDEQKFPTAFLDEFYKIWKPTETTPQYRMLEVGELIQKGDEFEYYSTGWREIPKGGGAVPSCHRGMYRRPLK